MLSLVLATALIVVSPTLAALGSPQDGVDAPVKPENQPARGLIYDGLKPMDSGVCAGMYKLRDVSGPARCTHGPDPAPKGVDVRDRVSTRELLSEASAVTESLAQAESAPEPVSAADSGPVSAADGGNLSCNPMDGTSGKRVQVIYASIAPNASRYEEVLPAIRAAAAQVDAVYDDSAETQGGDSHIRYVTTPGCQVDVDEVQLTASGDDNFANTVDQINNTYTDPNRKYMVFVDSNVICGEGQLFDDTDPLPANNFNDGGVPGMISRIDQGCWLGADHSTPVHEFTHTMGGVQNAVGVPHRTTNHHCTDDYDVMCYDDDNNAGTFPVTQTCTPLGTFERLLDCGHDDYFAVAPAGAWLATHWNIVTSSFLTNVDPPGTRDTTAPDVTKVVGPAGLLDQVPADPPTFPVPNPATTDQTPTFRLESSEANSTFMCHVAPATVGAGGFSYSIPNFSFQNFKSCPRSMTWPTTLAFGQYVLLTMAVDPSGNVKLRSATDDDPVYKIRFFKVDPVASGTQDLAAPATSLTGGPSNGSSTNQTQPIFAFDAPGEGGTKRFDCRFNAGNSVAGTAWFECDNGNYQPATALADGQYTFQVRSMDNAGNLSTSPQSSTFTVNTGGPTPPAIPTGLATSPATTLATPSNDTSPEVTGTVDNDTTTVKVYKTSNCGGASTDGTTAQFEGGGITVSGLNANGTTALSAQAVSPGGTSSCSNSINYFTDSTGPIAPVGLNTSPGSPANDNNPELRGTASSDTVTVQVFKNGTCNGAADGSGSKATFEGAGVTVPNVTADTTTALSARGVDQAGNPGTCSTSINYVEDSTGPTAPTGLATTPATTVATPSTDDDPEVRGTASGDTVTVQVFKNGTCNGAADASGTKATFEGAGITLGNVPPDATTAISARGVDSIGNPGTCSTSINYFEDSTGPTAPTGLATDPASPSNNNNPRLRGTASSDTVNVQIFRNGTCNGTPDATGTKATFEGAGIQVVTALTANQTTPLTARGVDQAGNTGTCSSLFNYVEDSTGPTAPSGVTTNPASPSTNANPGVRGTASGDTVNVQVFKNGTCNGAADATGTKAAFESAAGIPVTVTTDATTTLSARGVDGAGNTGTCSTSISYTHDASGPNAPTGLTTNPISPSPNNNPGVRGTASGDTVNVQVFKNGTCTGAPDATGTKAAFESAAGIPISVTADATTTISARGVDAGANTGTCSSAINYVEDSTGPNAPTGLSTNPTSPSPNNSPGVRGTASGDTVNVQVFKNGTCNGAADATGTKAAFESAAGIPVSVTADASTTLSARGVDQAGNTGACSSSITYVEDSTGPNAPTGLATDPASPSNNNDPKLKGNASGDTVNVQVFKNGTCNGAVDNTGSKATFEGAGVQLTSVAANATTTLSARGVDQAGNTGPCSSSIAYVEDSTGPIAPTGLTTNPTSPSSNNDPGVRGTASGDTVNVQVFKNGTCNGAADATGTKAAFESVAGIPVSVVSDATTTLSARGVDGVGNTGTCSSAINYIEDSAGPAAPTGLTTNPASPSSNNNPGVRGTASGDTVNVQVFKNGTCNGAADATGTKAAFESAAGIPISVTADATTTLSARGVDAGNNTGTCSSAINYVEDSTGPNAPTGLSTDPASPSSNNNPGIRGTASGDSINVQVFKNGTCNGAADATGTKAAFESAAGIPISVTADTSTTISARGVDQVGNTGGCATSINYVEDSTAPPAPTGLSTAPASPSNDNDPEVKGNAAGDVVTVQVFKTSNCTGGSSDGTKAQFEGAGITVSVTANATTALSALAIDGAGNVSPCSGSINYVEDSTAPAVPATLVTDPGVPANDNNPEVKGTGAEGGSTVRVYKTNNCSGGSTDGPAAAFNGSGITISVNDNTSTPVTVDIRDAAGNVSACAGPVTYVEDSTVPPPAAPTGLVTVPSSPADDDEPEVKGSVDGTTTTVRIYRNGTCNGAPAATGTDAEFEGGGITLQVDENATTTISAEARNSSNGTSTCSASVQYTEVTPPAAPTGLVTLPATSSGSPADDNNPEVTGIVDGLTATVNIFRNGTCGGAPDATGPAATFMTAGITVPVGDNTTTSLSANAVGPTGTSACSTAVNYFESTPIAPPPPPADTSPPESTFASKLVKKTRKRRLTFAFTSNEASTFLCKLDKAAAAPCSSPFKTKKLKPRKHTFTVQAVDAAGNADPSPAVAKFTVKS